MATVTNFMGLFSTFVFVAYAGIAYEYGLVSVTVFWSTVPACIIGSLWLGGRWRRTGCVTPIEYLEQRYSFSVREIMTWVGLLVRLLDNMVRLYAIGVFITVVTPLSLEWAIIISGVIVTLFNIIGGIWTVTIMSTVQFVILILITCVLLPVSLHEVGGIGGLYQQIPEKMTWFNGPKGAFFWLAIYYVMTMIKYNENWTFIQKFFCVKDEKAAKKMGVLTGILFFSVYPDIPHSGCCLFFNSSGTGESGDVLYIGCHSLASCRYYGYHVFFDVCGNYVFTECRVQCYVECFYKGCISAVV